MLIYKIKHKNYLRLAAISILTLGTFLSGLFYFQHTTKAADLTKFDPGNIMSDAVMANKNTMSVQQIQDFLNSKNPCNNTNVHMATWYPHLRYSIKDDKFVCMAQEDFNGESAAQIIWRASQDFRINPQVLLVLLEKEQGLISDTWPNHVQYRTATGFGCPDTAPCESQYFGLRNQIRLAASLFRSVLDGGWSNYPIGNSYVQYHPNSACGGSTVRIQNRATSALYRYTPYQPNRAALNAGYGLGDKCSAYGNRNFYALFEDWFGSTRQPLWSDMKIERVMVLNKATKKINPITNQQEQPLPAGMQIRFKTLATLSSGDLCLRTLHDTTHQNNLCIPYDHLSEHNLNLNGLMPNNQVSYRTSNSYTCRINYPSMNISSECYPAGTILPFKSSTSPILGTNYITDELTRSGSDTPIFRADRFNTEQSFVPISTTTSQWMSIKRTCKINFLNNSPTNQCFPMSTVIDFSHYIRSRSNDFIITNHDIKHGYSTAFKKSDFTEAAPLAQSLKSRQYTCKVNWETGIITNVCVPVNNSVNFSHMVTVGGKRYAVTQHDVKFNNNGIGFYRERF